MTDRLFDQPVVKVFPDIQLATQKKPTQAAQEKTSEELAETKLEDEKKNYSTIQRLKQANVSFSNLPPPPSIINSEENLEEKQEKPEIQQDNSQFLPPDDLLSNTLDSSQQEPTAYQNDPEQILIQEQSDQTEQNYSYANTLEQTKQTEQNYSYSSTPEQTGQEEQIYSYANIPETSQSTSTPSYAQTENINITPSITDKLKKEPDSVENIPESSNSNENSVPAYLQFSSPNNTQTQNQPKTETKAEVPLYAQFSSNNSNTNSNASAGSSSYGSTTNYSSMQSQQGNEVPLYAQFSNLSIS
eukprot:CAMPEP_0117038308 /NCGR_PEP_ID=MMETSP0472-20121206/26963_1 /TAXON_ID=693140 ORGANISM="Tiarina fusus, Strain LIS" /NCGR_SAMPLE_ID=MMETSP0472 /ASSEMBLY_ACC=CAM_ASM_000603 /LENGTH=300 /DNA_ID=CAMNT_0004748497 /DNA_START=15 /DNA_END=914 /DNA_ORIENTATION=+